MALSPNGKISDGLGDVNKGKLFSVPNGELYDGSGR